MVEKKVLIIFITLDIPLLIKKFREKYEFKIYNNKISF